jgi:hypothetical protein
MRYTRKHQSLPAYIAKNPHKRLKEIRRLHIDDSNKANGRVKVRSLAAENDDDDQTKGFTQGWPSKNRGGDVIVGTVRKTQSDEETN